MRLEQKRAKLRRTSLMFERIAEAVAILAVLCMAVAWGWVGFDAVYAIIWLAVSVGVFAVSGVLIAVSNAFWSRAETVISPVTAEMVRRACMYRDHDRRGAWEYPVRGAEFTEVGYIGRHEKR